MGPRFAASRQANRIHTHSRQPPFLLPGQSEGGRSNWTGPPGQAIGRRDPFNVRFIVDMRLRYAINGFEKQSSGNMKFAGPLLGSKEHGAPAAATGASGSAFAGDIPVKQGILVVDRDICGVAPHPSNERRSMRSLTSGAVAMSNPL